MSAGRRDAPSTHPNEATSRRGLLALMGAGGAAALAAGAGEARAGHDGTNVLHLGAGNSQPPGAQTFVGAHVDQFMLAVDNASTGSLGGGIHAVTRGSHPAVQGLAIAPGRTGVFGVTSVSGAGDLGEGPGVGVVGAGGDAGVDGSSPGGAGVRGSSPAGVGGAFSSASGRALQVDGVATVFGDADGDMLTVGNGRAGSDLANGISATVQPGAHHAVEGVGLGGEETTGVVGVSGDGPDPGYGNGNGVGVLGQSGTGTGVVGIVNGAGTGVEARCGVEGDSLAGRALVVNGRAGFSTSGSATVPAGSNSVFVAAPAVTDDCHVSVTLASDPGSRQVQWVERRPGAGFVVHLSGALLRRPQTALTYLIVEPAV